MSFGELLSDKLAQALFWICIGCMFLGATIYAGCDWLCDNYTISIEEKK